MADSWRPSSVSVLTAVFDIGKTNKKFILFDEELSVVDSQSVRFDEVVDDDGDPCEDLDVLIAWIGKLVGESVVGHDGDPAAASPSRVGRINFSTYGASLVHLDEAGQPVTPLYNYLKPYPQELLDAFHSRYGPADDFAAATGSPTWGMLNSGLQLYWMKHQKPAHFGRIRYSLHLPQYCSYLLSGHVHDEPTSLGCHTAMWDYGRADYHEWLKAERVSHLLPPRVKSTEVFPTGFSGSLASLRAVGASESGVLVGAGVHDSSAALYPYLKTFDEPFVFISTGTWIVTMNPFGEARLDASDVRDGALCYMTPSLQPVKSVRMFLGHEHDHQLRRIATAFNVQPNYLSGLVLEEDSLVRARESEVSFVPSVHLASGEPSEKIQTEGWDPARFASAEVAYHALVDALVNLQLQALQAATGSTPARRVFVDGGFARNHVFLTLLARAIHPVELLTTELSQATAIGAALLVQENADADQLKARLNTLLQTSVVPLR